MLDMQVGSRDQILGLGKEHPCGSKSGCHYEKRGNKIPRIEPSTVAKVASSPPQSKTFYQCGPTDIDPGQRLAEFKEELVGACPHRCGFP